MKGSSLVPNKKRNSLDGGAVKPSGQGALQTKQRQVSYSPYQGLHKKNPSQPPKTAGGS